MNQKKELIKNTIIISIGKFSTKIVSCLLLPLYTAVLIPSEKVQVDLLNRNSFFDMLVPFRREYREMIQNRNPMTFTPKFNN